MMMIWPHRKSARLYRRWS